MRNSTFWKKFTFWEKYDGLFIYWMANWEKIGNKYIIQWVIALCKVWRWEVPKFTHYCMVISRVKEWLTLWILVHLVPDPAVCVFCYSGEKLTKSDSLGSGEGLRKFMGISQWKETLKLLNFASLPLPPPLWGSHFCPRLPLFSNMSSLCLLRKSDHSLT